MNWTSFNAPAHAVAAQAILLLGGLQWAVQAARLWRSFIGSKS